MREALLEIDFQNWIVNIGHDRSVTGRALQVRRAALTRGALLVCSRYLSNDLADSARSDPDSQDAAWHPDLTPPYGALIISKHGQDVCDNPDLVANLRTHEVDRVTLTGIATDYGVSLAARTLAGAGFGVRVESSGCAGTTLAAHQGALEGMARDGIDVAS